MGGRQKTLKTTLPQPNNSKDEPAANLFAFHFITDCLFLSHRDRFVVVWNRCRQRLIYPSRIPQFTWVIWALLRIYNYHLVAVFNYLWVFLGNAAVDQIVKVCCLILFIDITVLLLLLLLKLLLLLLPLIVFIYFYFCFYYCRLYILLFW